jgi:hypothetical protein
VGLSTAAILLAVALVVGLLAWTRRDLRTRGASPRVWWLIVGCYVLAGLAWLAALLLPLPVGLAWLATVPAAVVTVVPERVAIAIGAERPTRRRTRPVAAVRHVPRAPMARRAGGTIRQLAPVEASALVAVGVEPGRVGRSPQRDRVRPASRPSLSLGRPRARAHRWHPGDLRLAVDLLRDAARLPELDEEADARIETRLGRLDRFRSSESIELLELVRDDVHACRSGGAGSIDDVERSRRIAALLDMLDPVVES